MSFLFYSYGRMRHQHQNKENKEVMQRRLGVSSRVLKVVEGRKLV